jgi:hypothetical protein
LASSISSALRNPNLPTRARAAASIIVRFNNRGAFGKTRHAARRPHDRSRIFSDIDAGVVEVRFTLTTGHRH